MDAEVRRLCSIDGGVKIYETVKLSAEFFDKWSVIRILINKDATPQDEYYYAWKIFYHRQGSLELSRGHFRVVRQKDLKLLGESIYYGRGGGDILRPWHDPSFQCPDDADISVLKNLNLIDQGRSK